MIIVSDIDRNDGVRGLKGHDHITDTDAHTGKWCAITALEATVVNELITNVATESALSIPAGATIYGYFTSIDLTSGSVLAYRV